MKSVEELGEGARESIREENSKKENEEQRTRIIEEAQKQARLHAEKAQVWTT